MKFVPLASGRLAAAVLTTTGQAGARPAERRPGAGVRARRPAEAAADPDVPSAERDAAVEPAPLRASHRLYAAERCRRSGTSVRARHARAHQFRSSRVESRTRSDVFPHRDDGRVSIRWRWNCRAAPASPRRRPASSAPDRRRTRRATAIEQCCYSRSNSKRWGRSAVPPPVCDAYTMIELSACMSRTSSSWPSCETLAIRL